MNVAQETLDLRRGGFSPPLSLLMSAFALLIPPADLSICLHRLTERSPTAHALVYTLRFLLHPSTRRGEGRFHAPGGPCTRCDALKRARAPAASVTGLAPLHLPRRTTRSVSYYAVFKGWL